MAPDTAASMAEGAAAAVAVAAGTERTGPLAIGSSEIDS
jgi:hypothetical protein